MLMRYSKIDLFNRPVGDRNLSGVNIALMQVTTHYGPLLGRWTPLIATPLNQKVGQKGSLRGLHSGSMGPLVGRYELLAGR